MIKNIRLLLLPFSIIYGIVTFVRNKLYDWGVFKSVKFDIPVICVGNLVVGGAGKTPATEYLVNLLSAYRIAILSRGYGRKTTGFILADANSTAHTIGDEPMQYYTKFSSVTVAVCEDRVKGIRLLENNHDLIILDDAFQHRSVQPGLSIVLFEFQKLFKPQFLLPAGNLREYFIGYRRADLLLITKSPGEISLPQRNFCSKKFNLATGLVLAFSYIEYQHFVPAFTTPTEGVKEINEDTTLFLLTGIANPEPLTIYLEKITPNIVHHNYADHHQFTVADIKKLLHSYSSHPSKEKIIVTTEKDTQRLLDISLKHLLVNLPVFYLPIKIDILAEDKATFDQKILNYVSSATRNR